MEHYLLAPDCPYVAKDPWLFAYCEALDLAEVKIDALIVPVRDLLDTSTSRVLQERASLAEGEWRQRPPVDVRGGADGGAIYSLDVVDQARLLATGFYRLVHWATTREIPIYLVDFPRIVEDAEYLIQSLWPVLAEHCSRQMARNAFSQTADPRHVRIGPLPEPVPPSSLALNGERGVPTAQNLDRDAMSMLLGERDREVAALRCRLEELETARGRLTERLADANGRAEKVEVEAAEARARVDEVCAAYDGLLRTPSWRVTRPLRFVRSMWRQ
jgi:hypothetical protein